MKVILKVCLKTQKNPSQHKSSTHAGAQGHFLKQHIAFTCVEVLVFFPLCILPVSVELSWCARDGSRWTSLLDGFRFSGTTSYVSAQDQSRRRTRDGSHEGVQTRKSVGGDGRSPRASRGRFEGSLEGTFCGGRNRRVSQVHLESGSESWTRSWRRNKFLWWRLRSVSRDWWTSQRPPTFSTSDRAPANGQFVAVRARCFGEGVDGSQVCRLGGSDHSPCCEETAESIFSIVFWARPILAIFFQSMFSNPFFPFLFFQSIFGPFSVGLS